MTEQKQTNQSFYDILGNLRHVHVVGMELQQKMALSKGINDQCDKLSAVYQKDIADLKESEAVAKSFHEVAVLQRDSAWREIEMYKGHVEVLKAALVECRKCIERYEMDDDYMQTDVCHDVRGYVRDALNEVE